MSKVAEPVDAPARGTRSAARWSGVRAALSFRNAAAVYVFVLLFVVFALWIPESFLAWGTWRSLLSDQAITCLVAVGLVMPVAAGVFDLAVGAEVGLGAIIVASLLVDLELGIVPACALSLLAGAAVGIFSWFLITKIRVSPFIATLGVSSVLIGLINWISASQQILNLPVSFAELGNGQLFGIGYPFYVMIAVAVVVWYVLERTPFGRRVYATGGSAEAATLAGVRTSRVVLVAMVTCGVVAALGGVLQSSQLSTGDPTLGPGFLLPTIAAVFLGSTQFRGGRYNVWGTVVAAYVLATGVKGLQLAGAPIWIPDLFNGLALLVAVGLAAYQKPPVTLLDTIRRRFRGRSAGVEGA